MSMIPRIDVDTASRAKLVEHIEQLEWMLADALPKFHETEQLRTVFGLTNQQSLILGGLMTGRIGTRQHLVNLASEWSEEPNMRIVDVQLCGIRKKLEPHGIAIKNVFGTGYQIDADNLQRLRALLEPIDTPMET